MRRYLRWVKLSLLLVVVAWVLVRLTTLAQGALGPVDAVLVLGGSIQREIYAAKLAHQNPELPILISQGSEPPCVLEIFQQAEVPLDQVWLEQCAESTFGNFYYSMPVLARWGARHVRVISTTTHFPRAGWLGQILLGARGIWMEADPMRERGIPANSESPLKTSIDVARALGWAVVSQVYTPSCAQVTRLDQVDMAAWSQRDYQCEHIVPQ
ncbi:YdcF family protein [Leptolyngbya sp. FACHB-261]|uniref:YdcF family protein n=1 Tax=Leptolyngbya sp. FACHB-261 TaxID=2692806 RepID=UPI001681F448|nr:ElyC/SanA/YdcF family protein [Leptolyngbya sp. FACHB-261]MBD2100861.1 YdcF family protein [Leptolyngbya sp. FACHB-261]